MQKNNNSCIFQRIAKSRQTVLKEELGASLKMERMTLKQARDLCREQAREIEQLKLKLASRDDEMKFLQRRVAEKDKLLRDASNLNTLKSKAAIAGLWEALQHLEEKVNSRKKTIGVECDRLERLIAGLEQHSMKGHHMVSSRTAIGLFLKIREGLSEIKTLAGQEERSGESLSSLARRAEETTMVRTMRCCGRY